MALEGSPSVSRGMNEVWGSVVGRFRPRHALDRALAEAARIPGDLFLQRVARECGEHRAPARQDAEQRAQAGAAQHRRPGIPEILHARPQVPQARAHRYAVQIAALQVADDLDDAEHPDHHGKKIDAVPDRRDAEGVARQAAVGVESDQAEQDADQHHADRLRHRAVREHHRGDESQHHEGEVVGRIEFLRQHRKRRPERGDEHGADAPGEERAERGHAERGSGAPLPGHLVAVDAGDDRRRFAGHVGEDRSGRAAVLRAVVDAGEHDQRAERAQAEGDRQQHRDGRDRPDAGKHPDQRSKQGAEQRVAQVLERRGRGEPGREIVENVQFHRYGAPHQAGSGCDSA